MYWWSDFDSSEVIDEFDVIASVSMSVVRIFLLWDDWQPTPVTVSSDRLRDLGTVLDIASERGLGLDITFFTGHMSGPNWSPGWLLDRSAKPHGSPFVRQVISSGHVVDSAYRNMFHDRIALDAERLLLETVVGEYRSHPGVWMWNLGNEPDLFAHPRSAAKGRSWVSEMTGVIKELDAIHPVTTGLHTANLFNDNGLRVNEVFAESDVAVMHGYPMYVDWARGPLDADFVPYLCALVTALSGKPCLAEEWGGCTSPDTEDSVTWAWTAYGEHRTQFMAGEEAFARYVAYVLPRLVDVGSTGAFMWCFADYAPDLWDRPPCDEYGAKHERHFGLVKPDGTLKPHAESIRAFAATDPEIRLPTKTVTLDVTPDEYYLDPGAHARRLYEGF
jgi:endo-1,4-beta-mannosidase